MIIPPLEMLFQFIWEKKKNRLNINWAKNIYLVKDEWKQSTFYSKV